MNASEWSRRVDACRCTIRAIAADPGRVCACGIKWKQRPNDPGGPGGWFAVYPAPPKRHLGRKAQR